MSTDNDRKANTIASEPNVEYLSARIATLEAENARLREENAEHESMIVEAAEHLLPFIAGHEHEFGIDQVGPYRYLSFLDGAGKHRARRDCSITTFAEILADHLRAAAQSAPSGLTKLWREGTFNEVCRAGTSDTHIFAHGAALPCNCGKLSMVAEIQGVAPSGLDERGRDALMSAGAEAIASLTAEVAALRERVERCIASMGSTHNERLALDGGEGGGIVRLDEVREWLDILRGPTTVRGETTV